MESVFKWNEDSVYPRSYAYDRRGNLYLVARDRVGNDKGSLCLVDVVTGDIASDSWQKDAQSMAKWLNYMGWVEKMQK